ncbi:MAG: hypothetical protein ACRDZY_13975, partial [Acidimicrobiales bacterium]
VSLATLVCGSGSLASYREASRLLAPLKKRAKAVSGSSWVLSRPGTDRVEVLRGVGRDVAVSRSALRIPFRRRESRPGCGRARRASRARCPRAS